MASNSSLVFWKQKEITPQGIFLTSSDSGGDRVLFWHSSPHIRKTEATRYSACTGLFASHGVGTTTDKDHDSTATDSSGGSTNQPCEVVGTSHNPFALNLITDRLDHLNDLTTSPTGPGSGSDRLCCASASGVPGVSGSLAGAAVGSTATMGPAVGSGPSGPYVAADGTTQSGHLGADHARFRKPAVEPNGLSVIGGLPTNILLGLLHQQTQETQRKIYVKVDNHVFIGFLFNVTGGPNELSNPDSDTESYASSTCRVGHSLISFGVVFAMDASALPSVLSHYAELARLTGTQIRRAESVFHYLSHQRNIIISAVDRTSPGLGYGEDVSLPTNPIQSGIDSSRLEPDCQQRLFRSSSSRRSHRSGCGGLSNSSIPGGPSSLARPSVFSSPDRDSADRSVDRGVRHEDFPAETTLDQLARLSSLCAELKTILDSVCLTGHVAVMIHDLYPIYFCLPHLAYSLIREPSQILIPAIRPMAVWRAMDRIRPYHALILLSKKEELIDQYIPPDINATMFDFVNGLSPTLSLHTLSVSMHSQLHCLTLALWLISRGFALVVYPIVANNNYVLSPHINAWFGPQLIGQFASMFPTINLAALLASFSTGLTLKDYVSTDTTDNRVVGSLTAAHPSKSDTDVDETEQFWINLSYTHKVELITWLLRRRLIIQIHIYVFCSLTTSDNDFVEEKLTRSTKSKRSPSLENIRLSTGESEHTRSKVCDTMNFQLDQIVPQSICDSVPKELVRELCQLFPESIRAKHVQTVLLHPGATQNLALLRLFCRIVPRLPTHLEELMFVESVDRVTLVDCVERFSPILCTARLPDPVTACFAGVDWPD
ncbi:hypothetical protein D915_008723 [Fasciola hepatica]|uniref:GATOR complex protein NPRL3 n=1 Tax=Fasciola hepatica TaxID=6192 RepID=A0A4E0QZI7_FASHE|nr:hypothetical protein D915_008723 [Fasciola hepatica]